MSCSSARDGVALQSKIREPPCAIQGRPRSIRLNILRHRESLPRKWCQVLRRQSRRRVSEEEGIVTVKTARGAIRTKHAVVATNSSISDVSPFTKTAPYSVCHGVRDQTRCVTRCATKIPKRTSHVRLQSRQGQTEYVWSAAKIIKAGSAVDADRRFEKLEVFFGVGSQP